MTQALLVEELVRPLTDDNACAARAICSFKIRGVNAAFAASHALCASLCLSARERESCTAKCAAVTVAERDSMGPEATA